MRLYKIQRMSDGLFSHGGSRPVFGKVGRTWETKRQILAHLKMFKHNKTKRSVYGGCRVQSFDLILVEDEELVIDDIFYEYSLSETAAALAGKKYW